jgi:hypothetical protein
MIQWKMRWTGYVASLGEKCIHSSDRKYSGRERPLGRHRRGWEDNVKIDIREKP